MNLIKSLTLITTSLTISFTSFADQANRLNDYLGKPLTSLPAKKVSEVGSVTYEGSIAQVSIPVIYSVSSCLSFDSNNFVSYVDKELPVKVNEEQRAYEVRSYFSKNKKANSMMASAMPFPEYGKCDKKVELEKTITLKLRMHNRTKMLATTVSIPMENHVTRYLVVVETKTGKVQVLPLGQQNSQELYKKLFSTI